MRTWQSYNELNSLLRSFSGGYMKIAIAQVNLMLGDLNGNVDRLIAEAVKARNAGASLIITPELALCGYPPEDLRSEMDALSTVT